jgi:anthranilate synthase component 1
MIVPDKQTYLEKTGGTRPMVVYREVLADMETPLSAYWKLAHDQTFSFLLESVTGGEQVSRFSILGIGPKKVIRSKNGHVTIESSGGTRRLLLSDGQDPLDVVKAEMAGPEPISDPELPTFTGGAIGLLGYDIVRFFESLPDTCEDDLQVDDLAMMLTDTVVVFDHAKNLIKIVATTDGSEAGYDVAEQAIAGILEKLSKPIPELPAFRGEPHPVESNMSQEAFESAVRKTREYIAAGDGIQMVVSQRFTTRVDAHAISVYRALRTINPSPYMFLVRFGDMDIVGASPEILVSLHGRNARVRPIAGTRWRGATPEEDRRLGEELLADEKERAEHIMLVDLGRNDLGRVCRYGTVQVNDMMVIERYSHVMHIVSDVTGELSDEHDAFDLIRAAFPAGTVSGAPKVRAMEIIDELEPTRRGVYAGSIGFISATGDLDMCIAIRTILLKDGNAYVQAGAGLVYDSDPTREYEETRNKAKAALRAIERAQIGL